MSFICKLTTQADRSSKSSSTWNFLTRTHFLSLPLSLVCLSMSLCRSGGNSWAAGLSSDCIGCVWMRDEMSWLSRWYMSVPHVIPPLPALILELTQHTICHHSDHYGAPTTPLWACGATPCGGSRPSDSFLLRSEGLDHAEKVVSGGDIYEGYGHGGPGVCLADGQT